MQQKRNQYCSRNFKKIQNQNLPSGWAGAPLTERAKNRIMNSRVLSKQAQHSELNINEMCAYIVATRNIRRTENKLYSLSLLLSYKLEFVMRWTVSQRFVPTSLHL